MNANDRTATGAGDSRNPATSADNANGSLYSPLGGSGPAAGRPVHEIKTVFKHGLRHRISKKERRSCIP